MSDSDSDDSLSRSQRANKSKSGSQKGRPSLEDLRKTLLSLITTNIRNCRSGSQLFEDHRVALEQCHIGGVGRNATVLHWIAWRMGDYMNKASYEFEAGVELAIIAMKVEPNLVCEVTQDGTNETPLHVALNFGKGLEILVRCMCTHSSRDALKKAIQAQNNKGENCLHLAIVKGLEITSLLVTLASRTTFVGQRKKDFDGKSLEGAGNTPLHDAVDYKRCLCEEPRCAKNPQCADCASKEARLCTQRHLVLDSLQRLIEGNDKALIRKNTADESPYLFFLSTSKSYRARLSAEVSQTGPQSNAAPMDFSNNLAVKGEKGTSRSISKIKQSSIEGRVSGSSKPDTVFEDQILASPTNNPNVNARGKDQNVNRPNMGIVKTPSFPMAPPPLPVGACEVDNQSRRIANDVERYLLECSFRLGGFEQACECLFGADEDKEGREPNFRPGYPIGANTHSYYDFLSYTTTLAQVDIEIQTPIVDSPQPSTKDMRDRRKADMESVKTVFDMLREKKGIKRILKLTVRDNPTSPCSDEIIEKCLDGFDVRYLDWNKPDICADIILTKAPNIVELSLYSSGNNAVFRGWAGSNGLCGLNQLTLLHLDAKQGLEEYTRYEKNVKILAQDLGSAIYFNRAKLYHETQSSRRMRLEESIKVANEYRSSYLEWQKEKEESLRGLRSELQDVEAKRKIEKLATRLKRERLKDTNVQERINEYQNDIQNIDSQCSRLKNFRKDANKLEVIWKKRPEIIGSSVKATLGIEFDNFMQHLNLPRLSSAGQSFATSEFKMEVKMEPRPQADQDEPEIELEEDLDGKDVPLKQNRWLDCVKSFVRSRILEPARNEPNSHHAGCKIKVALIDDGVDAFSEDLKGIISSPGWPRQRPTDKIYPFYRSATGHGTAMAALIKLACPNIRLYVVKLGHWNDTQDDRTDALGKRSTAETAANAIKWAIKEGVDIISMSWSLIRTKENKTAIASLTAQIQAAEQLGILMYCAAADQGRYGSDQDLMPKKALPHYIKAIGSAKEGGQLSTFVDFNQVDYLFPGEDIEELQIGRRKGSSAATALATGLAALILWCFARQEQTRGTKVCIDPPKMERIFNNLLAYEKWIDVTKLLGRDGSATIEGVVKRCESAMSLKVFEEEASRS